MYLHAQAQSLECGNYKTFLHPQPLLLITCSNGRVSLASNKHPHTAISFSNTNQAESICTKQDPKVTSDGDVTTKGVDINSELPEPTYDVVRVMTRASEEATPPGATAVSIYTL